MMDWIMRSAHGSESKVRPRRKGLTLASVSSKRLDGGAAGPTMAIPKKGGRLSAAFKSREETPKEGICGRNKSARTATT